jgi:hypothetical protein
MGCSSWFRIIPRSVTVVNSEKMIITSFAATSLERIQRQSCDKLSIGKKGLQLKCRRREVVPLEPGMREGDALIINKV